MNEMTYSDVLDFCGALDIYNQFLIGTPDEHILNQFEDLIHSMETGECRENYTFQTPIDPVGFAGNRTLDYRLSLIVDRRHHSLITCGIIYGIEVDYSADYFPICYLLNHVQQH